MANNTFSYELYELIKKTNKQKNRPLKIICDWDECLQPLKAAAIFKFYEGKSSFEEFFELFWENAVMEGSFSSGGKINIFLSGEEEKEAIKKYMKMRETMRNSREEYDKSFYGSLERWKTPLSNIAENLLLALKENLIGELIVISSYRKGQPNAIDKKRDKIKKTFGKFPQCELELTEVSKDETGKYAPYRWQRMNQIMPDWDIFIDDNPNIVNETIKNISDKNKIYILPDYKNCLEVIGPNVYHVKTTVSDITNRDFALGALEYRTNKLQQGIKELKASREEATPNSFPFWLIFLLGIGVYLIGIVIFYLLSRKKNKKD